MIGNKKSKEPKVDVAGNGHDTEAILAHLKDIATNQTAITDRLDDMEERISHNTANQAAILKLVNLFYDTDDKHVPELSYISPLAARPFAEALTLDCLTDEDVQSGKVSLNKKLILNFLRLQRSVRGRHIGIGTAAMQDQIAAENREAAEEFEAGRE